MGAQKLQQNRLCSLWPQMHFRGNGAVNDSGTVTREWLETMRRWQPVGNDLHIPCFKRIESPCSRAVTVLVRPHRTQRLRHAAFILRWKSWPCLCLSNQAMACTSRKPSKTANRVFDGSWRSSPGFHRRFQWSDVGLHLSN
jgi:hypothetical protein